MGKLRELFGVDVRSLASMRILLGLLIVVDTCCRGLDLRAHYTDFGVLPRGVFLSEFAGKDTLSLHLISGTTWVQAALFIVQALAGALLAFGWRTRLMTVLSWLLVVSVQGRNPMILHAGDVVLRMLLFWGMFLPLGATWSVDRALAAEGSESPPRSVVTGGTVALLMQVASVYLFTWLLKTGYQWTDGTAVYYALSVDEFTTRVGQLLLGFPGLLVVLTHATYAFELIGPILLFCPVFTAPVRTGLVAMFIVMHLGFALTMELGQFPYLCMAMVLAFLPGQAWDRLGALKLARARPAWFDRVLAQLPRRPIRWRSSWQTNALAGFFAAYVLLWNLASLKRPYFRLNAPVDLKEPVALLTRAPVQLRTDVDVPLAGTVNTRWLGNVVRLDQNWDMFSPFPLTHGGWYVAPGHLVGGAQVDVLEDGAPVTWEKPPLVSETFRNQRWRKYLMNLWQTRFAKHRLHYGRYLCRQWNERHAPEERLDRFEIWFVREPTPPPGEEAQTERVRIWEHLCSGPMKKKK